MDEIISKQESKMVITHVVLNQKKDIKLLRGFEDNKISKKRYMRNIVVMIENEFITSNIADTMLWKEELMLFEKGDEQNNFFDIVTRKINNKQNISLKLELSNKKEIFITKSEAKAICKMFDMALQGYSFSRLLEFETKQNVESWAVALNHFGYLEYKE